MSGRSVRGRGGGRGGRGGRFAPGMRPVDESTRIDIASALADFQASDETELTFPPGLSNHDRAVVHAECKKYGFSSKSFGKGEGRAVTVFKRRERAAREPIFELPLGETSLSQLNAYFNAYPPTESELASATQGLDQAYGDGNRDSSSDSGGSSNDEEEEEDVVFNQGGISKESKKDKKKKNAKSGKKEVKNADQQPYGTTTTTSSKNNNNNRYSRGKHAAEFSTTEIESRRTKWENSISKDSMRDLISGRHTLPIASYREEIVSAVRNNQVILIAGETGCGKTTQVPQYLVEDAWHRGKGCRVVCTQPRRISAMSVAERVAAERGETIGDNVGYTIRLESRGGTESSLMFCTNGILLRMLTDQSHDAMARVTHLVIDEIHERDRFADFLLILVRDLLPAHPHLRVVLMSATLHVELFSGYFGGCPVVRVPGFTHPVQDFYLEDVLKLIGYESAAVQEMDAALGGQGRGAAALVAAGGRGRGRGRGASNKQYYSGGGENNNSETRAEAAARDVSSSSRLSKEEKSQIEAAIEAAFRTGDDDAFELLMEVTGAAGADDIETGSPGVNVQHSTTGATALVAAAFHGRTDVASVLLANGADPSIETNNGMNARACAAQCNRTDIVELLDEWEEQARAADELASSALALSHYQSNTDADEVDLDLIEALLSYICGEGKFSTENKNRAEESQQGAVLIFFPGWDEIIRMKEKLESSPIFGRSTRYSLLPLHSMVAPQDQRKVFLRPPPGVRKIVMSTNMAETAITIDDVVCVIDSGRLKEKSYDAFTGVSTLQGAWISRASEKQRRGRAGRCQPGVAFHMYSRQRSEALAEFQLPELKRSPLDEMSLQVKLLETPSNTVTIGSFLAKAVEPPVPQAVDAAVALLGDIGALDSNEKLTTLGRHLAALPLPPALGKMLLYGVLYRCLDPVLTVACCMAYRDPWVLPANPGGKFEAAMLRGQWSTEAGGSSDHLSTVKAFNGWVAAKQRGGDHHYCVKNYLSAATMRMIDGMRTQLLGELVGRGFVRSIEDASTEGHRADLVRAVLVS
jgi:HrpA-like RNA helicase